MLAFLFNNSCRRVFWFYQGREYSGSWSEVPAGIVIAGPPSFAGSASRFLSMGWGSVCLLCLMVRIQFLLPPPVDLVGLMCYLLLSWCMKATWVSWLWFLWYLSKQFLLPTITSWLSLLIDRSCNERIGVWI